MTTTLRPAAPLTITPDGVRSRPYRVCVNGRPVGSLELDTDPSFGPEAGVLRSLRIDEPERGRGRGTVAALAAEEVLRGWGCRQVLASAPADADAARRLLGALGYAENSRSMVKELSGPPPVLPPGLSARPMTDEEFGPWRERCRADFARNWLDRGMTREQALAKSAASHGQALPEGLATPGAALRVLLHAGLPVGRAWLVRRDDEVRGRGASVYDVRVDQDRRGEGFGRALMLDVERTALGWRAGWIGLHVFADNTPALGLYASLGYTPSERHFLKRLL